MAETSIFPIPQDVRKMFIEESRPKEEKKSKNSESFQESISQFIQFVSHNTESSYGILSICEKFRFQRRRFYDVVNVLEALGAINRINTDSFTWLGMDKIITTIDQKIKDNSIDDPSSTLDSLFPQENKITISRLTIRFIMCFIALRKQSLSIQIVAKFLSRSNKRFKTTLCKLYQVVYILINVGIFEKRTIPSEVTLADVYYSHWCQNPISGIQQLANLDKEAPEFIIQRRTVFYTYLPTRTSTYLSDSD